MKKIFLLLFIPFHLFSQDNSSLVKPISKVMAMYNREGTILKQELIPFESVGVSKINLLVITDQIKKESISGIKFVYPVSGSGGTRQYSSVMDAEEISGLIQFLEFIKGLSGTVSVYTEYYFLTSGDLKALAFLEAGKKEWTRGVYIDKDVPGSYVVLSPKEITDLNKVLQSAQNRLLK